MKAGELRVILEDIKLYFETLKERYWKLRLHLDSLTFKYSRSEKASERQYYHEIWALFENVQVLIDIIDEYLRKSESEEKNGTKKARKTTRPKKGKRNDAK